MKKIIIFIILMTNIVLAYNIYQVKDISKNGTLSIREKPSIHSKKIGELPYNFWGLYIEKWTGLGTIQTAEGVQGLPKAFIQAGAKNIIMSLWQVDDSKTTELTRYFYENIKSGMGYKEALREAKLKMIDMHPYYWSGFVFSGSGI